MSDQEKKHEKKEYKFLVDNKPFETTESSLTGAQIKAIAGVPANYQLFLEMHGTEPDKQVSDAESLTMMPPPKHFYAVPPATFGDQK